MYHFTAQPMAETGARYIIGVVRISVKDLVAMVGYKHDLEMDGVLSTFRR